ncbi:MAG: glycosyltransferase [Pseudomonadota bacterium]
MRILIHVQHLLGSGHLVRMRQLAASLANRDHKVDLLTGGMPVPGSVPGVREIQLPPLKVKPGEFNQLLDSDEMPVRQNYLDSRTATIHDHLQTAQPDVLIVETYPFGRKSIRSEITTLLKSAHAQPFRPMVACSIRDILQRRTEERQLKMVGELDQFDLVLCHSDPEWIALDDSFDCVEMFRHKLFYSGFVSNDHNDLPCPASGVDTGDGSNEIVVSAGGGAVAEPLVYAAIGAARKSSNGSRWRILIGAAIDAQTYGRICEHLPGNCIVERNRPDFVELLSRCKVSISQAGYNTCIELLRCGCPSVIVPYARDGETEQTQRARILQSKGACITLHESQLNADELLAAIDAAIRTAKTTQTVPDLNGAYGTATILEHEFEKFRKRKT